MTTQEMNTNITNANEPAEKKTNKKKAIGICTDSGTDYVHCHADRLRK